MRRLPSVLTLKVSDQIVEGGVGAIFMTSNHIFPYKGSQLDRSFEHSFLAIRMKFECRKRSAEAVTVHGNCFARYDSTVGDNV